MFYTLLHIQHFFESVYETFISLLRIVLRFRFRHALKKHRVDGHKRLVILGNGPSLNQSLEEQSVLLAEAELMAVNQFVFSDQFDRLRPSSYVLLDIGFFRDDTLPRVREITDRLIRELAERTRWEMRLFLPREGYNSRLHRELSVSNRLVEFVFFNRTNVSGLAFFRHWAYRNNLGMPHPSNVVIACLMLALGLGYQEVVLLGADHSWLENIRIGDDNRLISLERHFYDRDPMGKPTEKAHPETLKAMYLHDYLNDLSRTFSAYHLIRRFADQLGTRVLNGTPGSYIDAFERLR